MAAGAAEKVGELYDKVKEAAGSAVATIGSHMPGADNS
jgi:hypothetical protein